ncbi:MAG: hypothetical protein ACLU3F_07390 [Blautia wexlerae]
MSDKNNKVKHGLDNAHYALLTVGEDGRCPMQLPGDRFRALHSPLSLLPTRHRRIFMRMALRAM